MTRLNNQRGSFSSSSSSSFSSFSACSFASLRKEKKKDFVMRPLIYWLGWVVLFFFLFSSLSGARRRRRRVAGTNRCQVHWLHAGRELCSALLLRSKLLLFSVTEREGSAAAAVAMGRLFQCTLCVCVCVYIKNTKKKRGGKSRRRKKNFYFKLEKEGVETFTSCRFTDPSPHTLKLPPTSWTKSCRRCQLETRAHFLFF